MVHSNAKRKTRLNKFPLTLHPTGQSCKKIGGRLYYFGADKGRNYVWHNLYGIDPCKELPQAPALATESGWAVLVHLRDCSDIGKSSGKLRYAYGPCSSYALRSLAFAAEIGSLNFPI
jgi:hypothetical protein